MTVYQHMPPVWKSVHVPCPVDETFAIFTRQPTDWWPSDHTITTAREAVVFEPFVGGRWYERGRDGTERDWGRILHWEPGRRIRMSWLVDGRFAAIDDDTLASRIEVLFTPVEADSTLVTIGHVDLHRHGAAAARIRAAIDGPSPGDTLAGFAATVRRRSTAPAAPAKPAKRAEAAAEAPAAPADAGGVRDDQ
jgi:uncharacterized protein YndB with AHSA1/START domain